MTKYYAVAAEKVDGNWIFPQYAPNADELRDDNIMRSFDACRLAADDSLGVFRDYGHVASDYMRRPELVKIDRTNVVNLYLVMPVVDRNRVVGVLAMMKKETNLL